MQFKRRHFAADAPCGIQVGHGAPVPPPPFRRLCVWGCPASRLLCIQMLSELRHSAWGDHYSDVVPLWGMTNESRASERPWVSPSQSAAGRPRLRAAATVRHVTTGADVAEKASCEQTQVNWQCVEQFVDMCTLTKTEERTDFEWLRKTAAKTCQTLTRRIYKTFSSIALDRHCLILNDCNVKSWSLDSRKYET